VSNDRIVNVHDLFVDTGTHLVESLKSVITDLKAESIGPIKLAKLSKIDKVLASRILRVANTSDSLEALHASPGIEPLRKFLSGAKQAGASQESLKALKQSIERLDEVVRTHVGGKSQLEAMLVTWLPDKLQAFQYARKQSLSRAMAQLNGVDSDLLGGTVFFAPSATPDMIDITWVRTYFRVRRMRPGSIRVGSRRMGITVGDRHALTLDGRIGISPVDFVLPEFCSDPLPLIKEKQVGGLTYHLWEQPEIGLQAESTLVHVEHSPADIPRFVPKGANRLRHAYINTDVPCEMLNFDVFIHQSLIRAHQHPRLLIYDTAKSGAADVNDPSRDLDRIDMIESLQEIQESPRAIRISQMPDYGKLVQRIYDNLKYNPSEFRVFRTKIDYPIYGSQVTIAFPAEER
jgi:hypothetical protein